LYSLRNILEILLQKSTVKLSIPGRTGWGTGFFVSHDLVLTCSHVVKDEPSLVNVHWQQMELAEASVELFFPDPIDLALLRLSKPFSEAVCVHLDQDQNSLPESEQAYFFGYPDKDYPDGCPVLVTCEGLLGGEFPLIKFKSGQVRPGMSGSPMLNLATGKVFGIVKATRDRSSNLGGDAISATVIFQCFPELIEEQKKSSTWQRLIALPSYAKIAKDLIFDSYARSGNIDQLCHELLLNISCNYGLLESEVRTINDNLLSICRDVQKPNMDLVLSEFEEKISGFFRAEKNHKVGLPNVRSNLKAFGKSIRLNSSETENFFNLALCQYIDKEVLPENVDRAISLYEQSAKISPNFEQFHIALGIIFSKKKKFKQAIYAFSEAERILEGKDIYSDDLMNLIEDTRQAYRYQKFHLESVQRIVRVTVIAVVVIFLPVEIAIGTKIIFIVLILLIREILVRVIRFLRNVNCPPDGLS
jgi:Trypsin-like peptidase domain